MRLATRVDTFGQTRRVGAYRLRRPTAPQTAVGRIPAPAAPIGVSRSNHRCDAVRSARVAAETAVAGPWLSKRTAIWSRPGRALGGVHRPWATSTRLHGATEIWVSCTISVGRARPVSRSRSPSSSGPVEPRAPAPRPTAPVLARAGARRPNDKSQTGRSVGSWGADLPAPPRRRAASGQACSTAWSATSGASTWSSSTTSPSSASNSRPTTCHRTGPTAHGSRSTPTSWSPTPTRPTLKSWHSGHAFSGAGQTSIRQPASRCTQTRPATRSACAGTPPPPPAAQPPRPPEPRHPPHRRLGHKSAHDADAYRG